MPRKKKEAQEAPEKAPEVKVKHHAFINFGDERIGVIVCDNDIVTLIVEEADGRVLTGKAELKEE